LLLLLLLLLLKVLLVQPLLVLLLLLLLLLRLQLRLLLLVLLLLLLLLGKLLSLLHNARINVWQLTHRSVQLRCAGLLRRQYTTAWRLLCSAYRARGASDGPAAMRGSTLE